MNRDDSNNSLTCAGKNVAVRAQLGTTSSLRVELHLEHLSLHTLPPRPRESMFQTSKQQNRNVDAKMGEYMYSVSFPLRPRKSERGHLAIALEIMEELEAEFSR